MFPDTHLPLTPCFSCRPFLSLSGLQWQPESNGDPHSFRAHGHWCRCHCAPQGPHACICSVWCQYTPASRTYVPPFVCRSEVSLAGALLLQGEVSGFPVGTLCFASSPRLYLFSRHSCLCHRPLKLGPLPERDALLSWSQGCLAPHSLADSLIWDGESCHLPDRSLRNRETKMNPSLIEEGRRLSMQS